MARVMFLVLMLGTVSLYALGMASVALRARLVAPIVEEQIVVVRQTVVAASIATAVASPEPTETPARAALAPAATVPASTPTPPVARAQRTVTATATLEPTPTQIGAALLLAQAPTAQAAGSPSAMPTRLAAVAQSPTAAPAPRPAGPALAGSGTLGPGGTFAKSAFTYPGDRSVYTVNVHIEPDDASLLKNAGFIVYGPGGDEVIRGGAQPGRRPNLSANVITTRPGSYLVQVQNYDPARPIAYKLDVVPGPPG